MLILKCEASCCEGGNWFALEYKQRNIAILNPFFMSHVLCISTSISVRLVNNFRFVICRFFFKGVSFSAVCMSSWKALPKSWRSAAWIILLHSCIYCFLLCQLSPCPFLTHPSISTTVFLSLYLSPLIGSFQALDLYPRSLSSRLSICSYHQSLAFNFTDLCRTCQNLYLYICAFFLQQNSHNLSKHFHFSSLKQIYLLSWCPRFCLIK